MKSQMVCPNTAESYNRQVYMEFGSGSFKTLEPVTITRTQGGEHPFTITYADGRTHGIGYNWSKLYVICS